MLEKDCFAFFIKEHFVHLQQKKLMEKRAGEIVYRYNLFLSLVFIWGREKSRLKVIYIAKQAIHCFRIPFQNIHTVILSYRQNRNNIDLSHLHWISDMTQRGRKAHLKNRNGNTGSFESLASLELQHLKRQPNYESRLMLHVWRKASVANSLPLSWEQRCNLDKYKTGDT